MSNYSDFGFLTCSPKHSTFARGWLVVVIDCKYPIYYKFNKIFIFAMVIKMTRTLKKKVLAFGEDSCFWVCLRYKVAPLRCLGILGSGKVR